MSKFDTKTIRDFYGDPIEVAPMEYIGRIAVAAILNEGKDDEYEAYMSLTPKQAKQLAKALRKAARTAQEAM